MTSDDQLVLPERFQKPQVVPEYVVLATMECAEFVDDPSAVIEIYSQKSLERGEFQILDMTGYDDVAAQPFVEIARTRCGIHYGGYEFLNLATRDVDCGEDSLRLQVVAPIEPYAVPRNVALGLVLSSRVDPLGSDLWVGHQHLGDIYYLNSTGSWLGIDALQSAPPSKAFQNFEVLLLLLGMIQIPTSQLENDSCLHIALNYPVLLVLFWKYQDLRCGDRHGD